MFAIQHQGWCASARFAYRTYRKYGTSSKCRNGKGGPWANSVYILRGKEITTTLITQGSREAKTKINLFTLNIKMLNFLCSRQHYVYLSSYKKSVLNQSARVFALDYWVIDELFMSLRILYEYQKMILFYVPGSCRTRTTRNNCCVFPFIYRGRRYTSCSTARSKGRPWCGLTPSYDKDKLWGYCRGQGGDE